MKACDLKESSITRCDPKSAPIKTINIIKLCKERGCDTKTKANGYCNKHLKQIIKFGKIIKRTKYDLNEFMIDGDCCRIYLYDANGKKEGEAIIDADDIEKCKNLKWYYSKKYVYTGGLGPKVVCLSQIIMGKPKKGKIIDYISGNTMDNRKGNLRFATRSQMGANRKNSKNNTSGFKGVSWNLSLKKWRATIRVHQKKRHLGYFDDKTDAACAYNDAAVKYFGFFARINEVRGI